MTKKSEPMGPIAPSAGSPTSGKGSPPPGSEPVAASLGPLLDSVLHATDDGVLVIDASGRSSYHNQAFRRLWQLPEEAQAWPDRATLRSRMTGLLESPERYAELRERIDRDPNLTMEFMLPLVDGRILEARTRPQRIGGETVGRVWWFRDVTTRRQIELDLRMSEERFSHLFYASPFSILLATYPEGLIVDVNPAFTRLFERTREETVGRTTADINLWAEAADRERMLAELREHRAVRGMEFPFTTRSGELRVVYLTIELVQLHGRWHSLASSVDVTALKRAEAALHESEIRYRTLFDAISETIYLLSNEGLFLAINQAFESTTGWSREEWLGRPFWELIHPDDRSTALDMFSRAVRGDVDLPMDLRVLSKDGSEIIAECSPVHLVREGAEVSGFLGVARDVTRQRRLEDTLRHAQKMEALGTLAGGIAHDFNNILTAILGHAEYLRAEVARHPALADDVKGILGATARAKSLVRQILTFGRRQPEERKVVQLEPVVREAITLLRATLPSTVTIETDLGAVDGFILADSTQIHQVIVNLGTNAVHAMREAGGTLGFELARVEVGGAGEAGGPAGLAAGRYLRLRVRDTGQGMSADTLRRVFDPFFTTKAPNEGSGLGLAVVHGIVSHHDGAALLDSTPGAGTVATIYLPEVAGRVEPAEREDVLPLGNGERILLVDDEAPLVTLGTRLLERLGYRPVGHSSSEAALAAFLADPDAFDLVFTDLTMPRLTGGELARRIRVVRPDVPVVLTSGYAGAMAPEELARLGVREIVSKPFELRAVATAIARSLGPD
ncbi:MAG: PAS domain S-box protein [Gemmatimonadales bacterium]